MASAYGLGAAAGVAIAVAYGAGAEVFGLTWGLLGVGLLGGIAIGAAVARGAGANRPVPATRARQVGAALIALGAWLIGLIAAFVISQALLPQAATPLLERLSVSRFADYFGGLDSSIRFIHGGSLAIMAFMGWRGAR